MNEKESKKLITQKKFSLGECEVDKRGWFKFIGGEHNETFKIATNRYFSGRLKADCKLNITVEVAYEKNGSATVYETKQIDLLEKAPRLMTEKEWYMYVRSLVEDERDYWYVKVIEGVDVEFVQREIERKDIKMRELRLIDKFLEGVNCAEIESKGKNTCVCRLHLDSSERKIRFFRYEIWKFEERVKLLQR